jgi:hypothetical protein
VSCVCVHAFQSLTNHVLLLLLLSRAVPPPPTHTHTRRDELEEMMSPFLGRLDAVLKRTLENSGKRGAKTAYI